MHIEDITLDTKVPNGLQGLSSVPTEEQTWTLRESVENLKKQGTTRLFTRDEVGLCDLSERLHGFVRSVERGESPTIGQTLAAYYEAAMKEISADWMADRITDKQRAAREGAVGRVVFYKKDR